MVLIQLSAMLWLVWQHRELFLRLRDAMMVSGALGMVVFVSYPVAPPRLADLGLVDTVTEQSHAYRVLAIGVTGIISDDPTVLAELVSRRPADT